MAKPKDSKIGGLFYFFGVISLVPLSIVFALLTYQTGSLYTKSSIYFVLLLLLGVLLSKFITGHWATFIHELKHAFVANLAGNRYDKMSIGENSGDFSFKYSKATAHSNAFIALAPYFLPLFALIGFLASFLFFAGSWQRLAVIAIPLGIDLALAARDLGPWQSDFSRLRGGFYFGLMYVLSFQLCTILFSMMWAIGGWMAFKNLGAALTTLVVGIAHILAEPPRPAL